MVKKLMILADIYSDTANRIGRDLQCVISEDFGNVDMSPIEWVFRYGRTNSMPYPYLERVKVINQSPHIELAANKFRALLKLSDSGIRVPRFSDGYLDTFPQVIRTRYHSQGRGFEMIDTRWNRRPIGSDEYCIEFIDADREYRVLVFNGKVIGVDRKIETEELKNDIIRNHANGWGFLSLSREKNPWTYKKVGGIGLKAVEALELDFGAVDVLRKGNRLYVLEVNTAPGLRVGKAKRVANNVREMIGG